MKATRAIGRLPLGLRVGEALALEYSEIHPEPPAEAQFGYLRVREGRSRFARHNTPLTARVKAMLENCRAGSKSTWVFADGGGSPMLNSSLDHPQ